MYSLYDTWGFPCVFPHSEISGSLAMCAYPKLIAAYHVLHRLLMPRHSPCALCSLTYSVKIFQSFAFNITKNISWLTSQYILKLYYIIHMQFSKNKLVGLNGLEHADSRLLATPASCRRVSAYNPNWDKFLSFAPPRGLASLCTCHCSTCVALDIRGMMIWRHPHLPPG